MRTALTIAGSDSGAGAGLQADLKTFAAYGVYGTSAVTAVTAQNSCGVHACHPVPPAIVTAQIDAVAPDFGVDAAKTGMLATTAIVEAVAEAVERHRIPNLVVDPIILASSGSRLLAADAVTALTSTLLPLARVVTPNVHEAEVLAGTAIRTATDLREAARRIAGFGVRAVIITGGHLPTNDIGDLLFDGDQFTEYRTPREPGRSTHGTGCTFSAAVTAHLALGRPLTEAIVEAQLFVAGAITHGIDRGHGEARPMHHFWRTAADASS